jgi:2-polyprenyl-6-methoxyphenol hydroxylase-like FAD-dependent oxidoreductase
MQTPTQNRDILISGASVAGPALAYWLRRHGFNPTVVERAPAIREGGYKVDLRGAAVDVAERMGILADIQRDGTDMQAMSFVNGAGKRAATMSADLFMGRDDNDLEIMRGDLNRVLYEATRDDVEYIFDDSITAIEQGEDGVRVTFERGAPRTFGLVVGADGLHSNVRALTFGEERKFVRDLGHYASIFTVPNHLELDRWELVYPIPGRTANLYSTRRAEGAKALLLFSSSPLDYDRRDSDHQKKIVADRFAGAGWEVPRLLESMWDAPDFYFDSISQVRMDSRFTGRAVLIGDAGYGPSLASGQGTSMAMVGAYVLAGELAAAGGDHRVAFARYDDEMRHFIEQNQKLGETNIKQMVSPTASRIWFGRQIMRALPYLPGKNAILAGFTRPIHEAANAITLKDYR